ncbi:hypothetical protein [Stenotrophomonas indicatrix]
MIKIDPHDQGGHMFTPEGHQLVGVRDPGHDAEASNVVYMSRGPRPRQRV